MKVDQSKVQKPEPMPLSAVLALLVIVSAVLAIFVVPFL